MRNKVAIISGVIVLLLVNWSIAGKEHHLKEGKVVYIQLAPVDPRSLMQGDYMRLRFVLSNQVYQALPKNGKKTWRRNNVQSSDGKVIVSVSKKNIANFVRINDGKALLENERLLRYRVRNGKVKFATNAFFFQEGHAKYYQSARYGQFRVDEKGELLLTSMHDDNLKKLKADDKKI